MSLVASNVGGGVICLLMAFLPKDSGHSSMVLLLYFGGRIFSESAAYTCWFYTAELYPTNLRQALFFCNICVVFRQLCHLENCILSTPRQMPQTITNIPRCLLKILTLPKFWYHLERAF